MASLKLRKYTWYAVWTQNGKQVVRTTNIKAKGAKEKKLAQNTADAMEATAKGNMAVSSAVDSIRKAAETLGMASTMPTVKEYLLNYEPSGREHNKRNCKRAISIFLDVIGVDAFKLIPEGAQRATERVPFTMDEMRTIVNKFPYPWSQLALTSYLTGGQRLGDIATLKWSSVDFEKKVIQIRTSKTGKHITSPLVPMLEIVLKSLYKEGEEYVFPGVAQLHTRSRGKLSVEFTGLLKAHGILEVSAAATTGDRRPVSPKSFHSIRHTVVSQMRCNPAITSDLSREIVGHDSEAVERGYFTAPSQAKLDAFDFLCKQLTPASPQDDEG